LAAAKVHVKASEELVKVTVLQFQSIGGEHSGSDDSFQVEETSVLSWVSDRICLAFVFFLYISFTFFSA